MAQNRRRGNWKRRKKRRYTRNFPGDSAPECPYCNQVVRDILTAIAVAGDSAPGVAHFDCVLKHITDSEELKPKEKVVYLGNGSFGVVRFRGGSSDSHQFVIRKRIQIEPENTEIAWRKQVSRRNHSA